MAGEVVGEGQVILEGDASGLAESAEEALGRVQNATAKAGADVDKLGTVAEKAGAKFGGAFGNAADLVFDFVAPLGEAAAGLSAVAGAALGLGAGLVAAGGGLAVAAGGAKELADAAVEAADRLAKLGIEVGATQATDIQAYKAATADLAIAMDQLTVSVGGELAGDLAVLANAAASGVRAWTDFRDSAAAVREEIDLVFRVITAMTSLGLTEATKAMVSYGAATNDAAVDTAGLTEEQRKELEYQEDLRVGAWANARARAEEAEAARVAAEEAARAREAERQAAAARKATLDDAAAAAVEYQVQIHKLTTQMQLDWTKVQKAMDQSAAWNKIRTDAASATAAIQQIIDDRTEAEREAQREQIMLSSQATATIMGNVSSIADQVVASYEARVAAGEHLNRREQEAANRAVTIAAAAAVLQAGISSVNIGIGTYSQLVLAGTPWPAAAGIATGVAASSFASAIAAIAARQPPSFGTGRAGGNDGGNLDVDFGDMGEGFEEDPTNIKDGDAHRGAEDALERGRGRGRNAVMVTVDPRLQQLRVVADRRLGKTRR